MNKAYSIAFISAFLLLFASFGSALSSQEAINFATKQNNLLYSGEKAEVFPNVRVKSMGKHYWVITVLNGDTLAGFVPVLDDKNPSIPGSQVVRRELLKTAFVLRYQRELNEASSQQGIWIFDAQNVKFFSDLSQDLKDERVDLTTVKTSLEDFPRMQNLVDDLFDQLDSLYPKAKDVSDSLLGTASFESSFVAEPDTNRLKKFEKQFQDSFDLVKDLDQERAAYLSDLDALRQAIALTDLPIETKQGLNNLANVPNSLQQFGSKVALTIDLEESLGQVFDNASANLDTLASGLSTRESRNKAYQKLYGGDSEILEETGYGSLNLLMGLLLSEEYFFDWKNQEDLMDAKENWEKAESFYESGSFAQAEQFSARAKNPAVNTYKLGLEEEEPVFDTDLLFGGVVLLIVAVIIIYAVRNRAKLSALVSGSGEEEVELNEWDR